MRVLLVKLADRLHNMRTLEHMKPEKRAAHRRGDAGHLCAARRPHGHAGDARGAGGPRLPLAATRTPTRRSRDRLRRAARASNEGLVDEIETAADARSCAKRGIEAEVYGPREEALFDLAQDGATSRSRFEQLSDIYRLPRDRAGRSRTATARSASCTPPGGWCRAGSRTTSRRPSRTTTVDPHHGDRAAAQRVELQIRTAAMHEVAEYGVAAHALYKDATKARLRRRDDVARRKDQAPTRWLRRTGRDAAGGRRTRRSFSSTPSSSCSRTRCSASRRRAG